MSEKCRRRHTVLNDSQPASTDSFIDQAEKILHRRRIWILLVAPIQIALEAVDRPCEIRIERGITPSGKLPWALLAKLLRASCEFHSRGCSELSCGQNLPATDVQHFQSQRIFMHRA